ncbi:MAG: nuclear transport factor 2 family protein [Candidatus Nanopelagicales bacterium]
MTDSVVIQRFYDCFGERDAQGMAACYADDVVFRDPAFGELHGERARDMWRMLCRNGKDLQVVASGIEAAGGSGRAHWEAHYTFTPTGRKVHNVVEARFLLRDGLIVRHEDRFSFGDWSAQAFGPIGAVLGRTPLLPFVMRRLANRQLDQFQSRRA